MAPSFTRAVKAELTARQVLRRCCLMAELGGMVLGAAMLTLSPGREMRLGLRTQTPQALKRALALLTAWGGLTESPRLMVREGVGRRRQFELLLSPGDSRQLLREQGMLRGDGEGGERFSAPRRVTRRNCCRRSYLRGSFLACGYIADPQARYHAEFVFPERSRAMRLRRVLEHEGLEASVLPRRGAWVAALKGGDAVGDLLRLMDAPKALMRMEDMRAQKSLRESANRAVNCDNANLARQLEAARAQVEAIERISRLRGLNALPPRLEALARLRLIRPDASLEQLGAEMDPPLSKSAAARLMRQLRAGADAMGEDGARA
ncbi:MAG TPA: DNA-binding protein WhiA [Candidatus Limnocylindria bacterium]|nr:DNA-binding protein WhiA [Candidatus Limnocylindria bacterium]